MNSAPVAYTVDDGFHVKDSIRESVEGLMLLMSPLNIIVWDTRSSEISSKPRVFEHVSTFSVIPYISQEFKEKLPTSETFIGTSNRVAFESASWSPYQENSSPLLALSVHSDMSVHFKVMESVWRFGSLEFRQVISLMECLRDQWFLIPLYTFQSDPRPITQVWPSISMCLEGHVQLSFVAWSKGNILVTGWGCVVFIWNRNFECISAIQIPGCDFSNVPLKSVRIVEDDTTQFVLACESVRGTKTFCTVDSLGVATQSSFTSVQEDPFTYKVVYTPGKQIIQIVQTPAISSLDIALSRFIEKPTWEFVRLIALLYKPHKGEISDNKLGSILSQFSPNVFAKEDNYQIALALHTLYSKITTTKSMESQYRELVALLKGSESADDTLLKGSESKDDALLKDGCFFCGLVGENKGQCRFCLL